MRIFINILGIVGVSLITMAVIMGIFESISGTKTGVPVLLAITAALVGGVGLMLERLRS